MPHFPACVSFVQKPSLLSSPVVGADSVCGRVHESIIFQAKDDSILHVQSALLKVVLQPHLRQSWCLF